MTLTKESIIKFAKPVKPKTKWLTKAKLRLRYIISWIRVKLGLSVWAKKVYNRPKYQPCPMDGCQMKRGAKTKEGAYYYCKVERRYFHLEGGGTRLVPVSNPKKAGGRKHE